MTTKTTLTPGTHIPSQYGHYQSAYIVEQARQLGWQPKPYMTTLPDGTERYRTQQEENEYVDNMAVTYQEWGNVDNLDEWYDIVQEAEDYINENHVPEADEDAPLGYWYGHHADIGDIGVWEIEDE